MANKTLRKLARAYADGSIEKEPYRKARSELIQGIISSTIPLAEINYPPLVQPPEPESLDDTQRRKNEDHKPPGSPAQKKAQTPASPATAETTSPADDVSTENSGNSSKMLLIGLGIAVVVIIAVVIAMMGDSPKQTPSSAAMPATDKSSAGVIAPEPANEAQDLIRNFLAKKNWSSSNLDNFQQQWRELAAADIQASKDSLEMGQLTNEIYKQLLEEQALSGLVDDDSSINKQRQLVQFATELGIEDSRISLPEEAQSMNDAMQDL